MDRLFTNLSLAAVMTAAGALGFGVAALADTPGKPPTVRMLKVSAHRYEFVPNQITLKKGETVDIELSSSDVVMGFNAPDFATRGNMIPGHVSHISFTPTKLGTFDFLCDVFCGSGHEDMSGTITVVE